MKPSVSAIREAIGEADAFRKAQAAWWEALRGIPRREDCRRRAEEATGAVGGDGEAQTPPRPIQSPANGKPLS